MVMLIIRDFIIFLIYSNENLNSLKSKLSIYSKKYNSNWKLEEKKKRKGKASFGK